MNIYLCSTVRNLLIALLRSIDTSDVESYILVICDQQGIKAQDYDLSYLPSHIKIQFIFRDEIRRRLDSNYAGRIIRSLASLKIKTSAQFRKKIVRFILNDCMQTSILGDEANLSLFLFNDRNRIARLLRLAFSSYTVIEDGLANYYGSRLTFNDKLQNMIRRGGRERRYIGDDPRCREIYLLNPDSAPPEIRHKTKAIDFIKQTSITEICYGFFKRSSATDIQQTFSCILATQPIAVGDLTKSDFDLLIYKKILTHLHDKGIHVVLKIHPREDPERYRNAFPSEQLIDGKVPLELLIFGASEPCDIFSIYSSAGMGFEQFCRRLTLINDEESAHMAEIFDAWRADVSLLDQRIAQLLN